MAVRSSQFTTEYQLLLLLLLLLLALLLLLQPLDRQEDKQPLALIHLLLEQPTPDLSLSTYYQRSFMAATTKTAAATAKGGAPPSEPIYEPLEVVSLFVGGLRRQAERERERHTHTLVHRANTDCQTHLLERKMKNRLCAQ